MRCEQPRRFGVGASAFRVPRSAFTLVELLVVIAIIGLLAALLVAAVGPALTAAGEGRIRAEIAQLDTAIKDYKTAVGGFPPNAQIDGAGPPATSPIVESTVLAQFKQHLLKAFPNHREPDALIAGLVGLAPNGSIPSPVEGDAVLDGGMTAAEALVFWIGGFSDDPEYPISGSKGPSYAVQTGLPEHQQDPIENRSWRLGVRVENLGPRDEQKYFPEDYRRYVVYLDPRDNTTRRRINFWVLTAPGTKTPYLYFDTSRGAGVSAANDTPASTAVSGEIVNSGDLEEALGQLSAVYALKTRNTDASAALPFVYANNKSFQILHPGVDDRWIETPRIDPTDNTNRTLIPQELTFPDGPWVEELADTLTNFTDGTLEDAQP